MTKSETNKIIGSVEMRILFDNNYYQIKHN